MDVHPVAIIGAGPAGLAAAMQLSRQGILALVYEGSRVGGLLWNANWVENYPGFADGISGPDLVGRMAHQAERLGVKIVPDRVDRAAFPGDGLFTLQTRREEYRAEILVAATGTRPRVLEDGLIPAEAAERVFTEVVPLLDLVGKEILIVGAGDAALDYALNLAGKNRVRILNRGSEVRGLSLLWDRVAGHPAVCYHPRTGIVKMSLNRKGRLCVLARQDGQEIELEGDYLVSAIGREPDYSFAANSIISSIDDLQLTRKLFLIGDLVNGSFRQTALAVGDGIKAALVIGEILRKEKS